MSFLTRSVFASSSRLSIPIRSFTTSLPTLIETPPPPRTLPNPFQSPNFPPIPGSSSTEIALQLSDGSISDPNSPLSSKDGKPQEDPHSWWKARSNDRRHALIISKYDGRSELCVTGTAFPRCYKSIRRLLNTSGVKREIRLGEYYEKPSEKRVRLSSERHRKRFAAMVREKVEVVAAYRARN